MRRCLPGTRSYLKTVKASIEIARGNGWKKRNASLLCRVSAVSTTPSEQAERRGANRRNFTLYEEPIYVHSIVHNRSAADADGGVPRDVRMNS